MSEEVEDGALLLRLASLDATGSELARLSNRIERRQAWQPGRTTDGALLSRVRSLFLEAGPSSTILFQPERGLLFFNLDAIPVQESIQALAHLVDKADLRCRVFIDDFTLEFLLESKRYASTDNAEIARQRTGVTVGLSGLYEQLRVVHREDQHLLPHVLIASFARSDRVFSFRDPDRKVVPKPSRRRALPPRLRLPAQDELPITIYLADETIHEQVEAAVETLLGTADLHVSERDEPVIGSWFRRMWARVRQFAQSPAGSEAALTATHAADSRLILAQDAYVTATLLQNLGPVLTSLQPTKDAVLRIGALLIVKVDWVVQVYQLTASQQAILDHKPELATKPGEVIAALQLSGTAEATVPAVDDVGAAVPEG